MFDLAIKKENLLSSLLITLGAVDKKQSSNILSHFLLKLSNNVLQITATDLEIEISSHVLCDSQTAQGQVTVPAKKFIDIIRSLDESSSPSIVFDNKIVTIKQGRTFFKLTTLPPENYPLAQDETNEIELSISRIALIDLLQSTHFAMSSQDVRIFLNGLLLEFELNSIVAVATDGHRMAISRFSCDNSTQYKLLLPKRAVQELLRLLPSVDDDSILLSAGKAHFKVLTTKFVFSSKLIEARFPPYNKAIPRDQDKHVTVDCATLKRALTRIVILAHEKSRAVLLHLQPEQVTLIAQNNEQEEAEETLSATTTGDDFRIGLNATYLLDVLNHFGEGELSISMSNTDSSILIHQLGNDRYQYIIMPMKL